MDIFEKYFIRRCDSIITTTTSQQEENYQNCQIFLENTDGFLRQAITSTPLKKHKFPKLGPGRPSAGGPRMDRRVVTSLGVVKVSRLALRLRRSAQRGQGDLK